MERGRKRETEREREREREREHEREGVAPHMPLPGVEGGSTNTLHFRTKANEKHPYRRNGSFLVGNEE